MVPLAAQADTLDQYGGYTLLHVAPTGYFTKAKFGNRWMFVDPLGNAYFGRGADLISDTMGPAYGNVIKYATVYTYDSGAVKYSANLNVSAENDTPNDVVNDQGVTVSAVGDTIYIGNARPFNYTYFNVTTLGEGGAIQWYYSTGNGTWALINSTGNPASGSKLDANGSYNLDTGNWIAPGSNGFYSSGSPDADLITWWQIVTSGYDSNLFPANFAPTGLPNDPTSLYYIKGVVTTAFGVPPRIGQLYDSTAFYNQAISMKYIPFGGSGNYLEDWYTATMQRMRQWGLNMAGDYSYRYWDLAPQNSNSRFPEILTFQLSGDVMEARYLGSNAIEDVYNGAECNGASQYPGAQPDVFSPNYPADMNTDAQRSITDINDPWVLAINPEEADFLYGIDNYYYHESLPFAVMAANPYQPTGMDPLYTQVSYTDSHLYSKYALRDFLRYEYKDPSDPLPPFTIDSDVLGYTTYSKAPSGFELDALNNLNQAWGTQYTTWSTSASGPSDSASNAWGTGTGFMDEAGKSNTWGIYQYLSGGCSNLYYSNFATPAHPAITNDFNSFWQFFAERYGSAMSSAVRAVSPHTMIAPFLYASPTPVLKGIASYMDALEVAPTYQPQSTLQMIMDNFNGPLIYHDYIEANADSPMTYGGAITSVNYDGTNTTISFANGIPYQMYQALPPFFPDGKGCPLYPSLVSAHWTTIVVAGNYSTCAQTGQLVRMETPTDVVGQLNYTGDQAPTQAARAQTMVNDYNEAINQASSSGVYEVAAVSHWGWVDDTQLATGETGNYGLVTALDNAYDGVEDQVAVSKDANGRFVGGEDRNYGDAISGLSAFWNRLDDSSNLPGIGPAVAPQAAFTFAPASVSINQAVQFTDTSTDAPISWSWNFGDNSTASTLESPTHAYASAGIYTVILTATNASGSNEASHNITVTAAAAPPPGSGSGDSQKKGGGALGVLGLLFLTGLAGGVIERRRRKSRGNP